MRASKKFGLAAIVGGAAAYAMNRRRQGSALGGHDERTSRSSTGSNSGSSSSSRSRSSSGSGSAGSSGSRDKSIEFSYADEVVAERMEKADLPVDVTADSAPLVSAERDALTVPGEDGEGHRRRDQTAGKEAQEIAAEQVRERRSGDPLLMEDEE